MHLRKMLPVVGAPVHGNRSSMTCKMRCGDACFHEVPNTSGNEYFADVVAKVVSRRGFLKAGAVVGAVAVGGSVIAERVAPSAFAAEPALDFEAIAPQTTDSVFVPEGWETEVVMRWGDKLFTDASEFDIMNQTAAAQATQFGYNCDFLGFFDLDDNTELMMVNHEYTDEYIMFPDYVAGAPTEEQVNIGLAAHGLSVVAVAKEAGTGRLTPILDHELNRRFTAQSEFELTGPAAGHELLQTSDDPTGTRVLGTLNNCAGGLTPWGTWLTAEENFNQYFANADQVTDEETVTRLNRYGLRGGATERGWELFHTRFDIAQEPNEPNRFGWVVEVDPFDPDSTPKKRTALGRFKHEAGTAAIAADGRAVVYSGDDERFDYIYKFVSDAVADLDGGASANADLLDNGTLYVARFSGDSGTISDGEMPSDGAFDGTGEWIPLVHGDESFVDGFTAAEVLLFTRLAADTVGATKMDRPEDVETNPVNGRVYIALTNNTNRTAEQVDEANPRSANKHGHVIELTEAGGDAGALTFGWNILLLAGDPEDPGTYFGGFDKSQVSPISCPDNVTFDANGNLWISTDGNKLGAHDGLYEVIVDGDNRGRVRQFLSVPIGAECCGPWVTDQRVNVAIQHPGETDEATFDVQASHWPDGGDSAPRPSIVTVWPTATAPTASPTASASPSASASATAGPGNVGRPGLPSTGR
ncbi:PhoX family phosphatase [Tessaracoccus sp. OS52]|uniref:PhoX family protein n=1 Tax=Tessaracoccus sp. OS52 TaxID=2886691 RepID=UPI001D128802|nr:PhoX family phosphatase [Tessaracoccus sp. OS52]MCC2592895.1 PhoX family phosphatase [Tessaracoccus sp. OS52]